MHSAADDPVLESLRFPVGRFEPQDSYSAADTAENLQRLAMAPKRLTVAVRGLSAAQLDTAYRPGGWSARQVVHHVVHGLMNAEPPPAEAPPRSSTLDARPHIAGHVRPSGGCAPTGARLLAGVPGERGGDVGF